MTTTPSILFVCLGNICRSPMAEGAMRALARERGLNLFVDSAGTGGWHIGEPPDRRAIACAADHGVDISGLRGRQVARDDFLRFDHVVALDSSNFDDLDAMRPEQGGAALNLLMDFAPGRNGQSVADPYYGGAANFERAWDDIHIGVMGLIEQL